MGVRGEGGGGVGGEVKSGLGSEVKGRRTVGGMVCGGWGCRGCW